MATISEIRQAIGAALESTAVEINVYYYRPTLPICPAIVVYPRSGVYNDTYSGTSQFTFGLYCIVGTSDAETSQQILDDWLDPTAPDSLVAAFSDMTLGNVVATSRLSGFDNYGESQLIDGGTVYLVAELTLDVWT